MNNIIYLLILIFITGCSLNQSSKFWTKTERIIEETNQPNIEEVFVKDKALNQELNVEINFNVTNDSSRILISENYNNFGKYNFDSNLENISKYKFSKINNFDEYEPEIIFQKNNLIFFDNKGSILKFNEKSKLIWKKNFYSKSEKKFQPLLQFSNTENFLIVVDNIAKIYKIDLNSGELIWSKMNVAPFNSQIKIADDKVFVVDYSNTLRCYSLKNGDELWSVNTQNTLIKSKKKLSLIIIDGKIIFNNSVGDISAVDINNGQLLWQLPTQSTMIFDSAFSLKSSNIVSDGKDLIFSNNKNQMFSIDINSGSFNWETKVNSFITPIIVDNIIFTISNEGYLILIEKKSGNIIKVTDIFDIFKPTERENILPTGFIIGFDKIYLSTTNGRLLIIDISSGKTISSLKIDNSTLSRPFIMNNVMYIAKDNAVVKID